MADSKINLLIELREKAKLGGGSNKIEEQHKQGKFTARERIEMLLDEGSFEEYDMFVTSRSNNFAAKDQDFLFNNVITGQGTIFGRLVYVYAHDNTVFEGRLSEMFAKKIIKVIDQATKVGAPIIGLNDSLGIKTNSDLNSLVAYADIFQKQIDASGVVPQISAVFGSCVGIASYSPAISDFIVMEEKNSCMYLTNPKDTKEIIGEEISANDLGGAKIHSEKSGMAHFVAANEEEAIEKIIQLVNFLPQNNLEEAPQTESEDEIDRYEDFLNNIIPTETNKLYNVLDIITGIADDEDFLEIQANYAKNIVVGFAKFDGISTGIVANQSNFISGVLDIQAARKAAKFVRLCNSFNIPIVTLVDVPGFMPGSNQEQSGIIMHTAKLMFAYAEATVPKITITLRKSIGAAHNIMSAKQLRGDINYAWTSAEISPDANSEAYANPYKAAQSGLIDDIIEPRNTRFRIIRALYVLSSKKDKNQAKKHTNIPL